MHGEREGRFSAIKAIHFVLARWENAKKRGKDITTQRFAFHVYIGGVCKRFLPPPNKRGMKDKV